MLESITEPTKNLKPFRELVYLATIGYRQLELMLAQCYETKSSFHINNWFYQTFSLESMPIGLTVKKIICFYTT